MSLTEAGPRRRSRAGGAYGNDGGRNRGPSKTRGRPRYGGGIVQYCNDRKLLDSLTSDTWLAESTIMSSW